MLVFGITVVDFYVHTTLRICIITIQHISMVMMLKALLLLLLVSSTSGFNRNCSLHRRTVLFAAAPQVEVTNLDNQEKTMMDVGQPLSLAAARTGLRFTLC